MEIGEEASQFEIAEKKEFNKKELIERIKEKEGSIHDKVEKLLHDVGRVYTKESDKKNSKNYIESLGGNIDGIQEELRRLSFELEECKKALNNLDNME